MSQHDVGADLFANLDLTPQQIDFCLAYAAYRNATRAAKEAGYTDKNAASQGSRLLKQPKIREGIRLAMMPSLNRYEVTRDRIVAELAKVAFGSVFDYLTIDASGNPVVDLSDLTPEQKAALSECVTETVTKGENATVTKVRFKMHDKMNALEKLGRQLGMFGGESEDNANDAQAKFAEFLMRAQGSALPIGGSKE